MNRLRAPGDRSAVGRRARAGAPGAAALLLAEAGLRRLGLVDRISMLLQPPDMYPAVGQGAIGIECRSDDEQTIAVLQQISNPAVQAATCAERALLSELRAGCHAPLGVLSVQDGTALSLTAVLLSLDGKERLEATVEGSTEDPAEPGKRAAEELIANGGDRLV